MGELRVQQAEPAGEIDERPHLGQLLRIDRGHVHRVRHLSFQQEVGDQLGGLDRDILLGLDGTGAEMRGEDDVRGREQGIVGCGWFSGKHVHPGSRDRGCLQGRSESRLVDDPAAGDIEHARRLLHQRQFAAADQAPGLGTERHVDGEEVHPREQFVEAGRGFEAELGSLGGGDERIEGDDLHVERGGAAGDLAADPAEPDNAERLARQLRADELAAVPAAGLHRRIRRRDLPRQGKQQSDRVFRGGNGVPARRVHDHDALAGGGRHVNVVDADAGPGDGPQLAGVRQHLGRDLSLRADNDSVALA